MIEIDDEILEIFREESEDLLNEWESVTIRLSSGANEEDLNTLFRVAHTLKGSSNAVGMTEFGGFVHHVEDVIRLAQKDEIADYQKFVELLLFSHRLMNDWINSGEKDENTEITINQIIEILKSSAGGNVEVSASEEPESDSEDVIDLSLLDQKSNDVEVEENLSLDQPASDVVKEEKREEVASIPKKAEAPNSKKSKSNSDKSEVFRVKRQKIDEIIKTVGEIGTHLSIMDHYSNSDQKEKMRAALEHCLKYNKMLQGQAISLSMQPVDRFFQRLERICLDVARNSSKEVRVLKEGSDLELDKTVLDKIADPFIHIVRNATDHGIEAIEERLAAGKSETGTIIIAAEMEGGQFIIKVSDDGAGIDPERIRTKAISRGLISEEDQLTKDQIIQLILLPGFSTNESVTEVSGRGVGMDVVNTVLNDLGGSLDIKSELGVGSEFIVRLPTNFSLVESIITDVGSDQFGIPLKDFSEVIDLHDYNIQTNSNGQKYFKLRDEIVSLHDISEFLKLKKSDKAISPLSRAAVINRSAHKPMAFRVNRIIGRRNLFVKPLSSGMENLLGVTGTTVMPDGKAGLILNLADVAREYQLSFKGVANG